VVRLENRRWSNPTVGSNPTLSANFAKLPRISQIPVNLGE
jgi:hypothetical protein